MNTKPPPTSPPKRFSSPPRASAQVTSKEPTATGSDTISPLRPNVFLRQVSGSNLLQLDRPALDQFVRRLFAENGNSTDQVVAALERDRPDEEKKED